MSRLQEIETRKAEIKLALDLPEANLEELETEIRALQTEEVELRSKIEKRKALTDSIVLSDAKPIKTFEMEKRKVELMDRDEILASPEYRSAFFNETFRVVLEFRSTYASVLII